MDRGVRAGPTTPQKGSVRTSHLIQTRGRGNTIPIPRCHCRSHQRGSHSRDNRGPEARVFHEQGLAGPRAQIPSDRKSQPRPRYCGEEIEAILSCPHDYGQNRPTHKSSPGTTRHGGENAQMVPRT
ncbi:hypothetical protein P8452_21837 [Trifolium repens]|nr:hypothetical protein P8452_21837 [Trifolium repens]